MAVDTERKALTDLTAAARANAGDVPNHSWLTTLILSYEEEHDWANDPDPDVTREMLAECRRLALAVEAFGPRDDRTEADDGAADDETIP